MRFYFAYGSNMWVAQMNSRGPGNSRIGSGVLPGYRWNINSHGYATLVTDPDETVHGIVYTLTAADKKSLDDYEEVSLGLYRKQDCKVKMKEMAVDWLVCIDPVTSEGVPDAAYIARINYGLRDARLPGDYVERVIRRFVPAGA